MGARTQRKDTTLEPGEKATWTIPRTLLGLGAQEALVLAAHFYFGTDPNPRAPKAKVEIFETTYSAENIPACPPE